MIARHPCGTQSNSLPLLPPGPGGVRKSLLRRTRLSNRKISGGEGGIRTHGTLPHTRVPGVHLKPLGHLSSVFRINQARWPMGHHPTTPALSCKEENGRADEIPASSYIFISDSQKMPHIKQRLPPGQNRFTSLGYVFGDHLAKFGFDSIGIMS